MHGATSTDARRDVHFIAQGENQKKDRFDILCSRQNIIYSSDTLQRISARIDTQTVRFVLKKLLPPHEHQ